MGMASNAVVLFGFIWVIFWPLTLILGLFQFLIARGGGKMSKGLIIPVIMYIIPFLFVLLAYIPYSLNGHGMHSFNFLNLISSLLLSAIFPGLMYLFYRLVYKNEANKHKDNSIDKMKVQDL